MSKDNGKSFFRPTEVPEGGSDDDDDDDDEDSATYIQKVVQLLKRNYLWCRHGLILCNCLSNYDRLLLFKTRPIDMFEVT